MFDGFNNIRKNVILCLVKLNNIEGAWILLRQGVIKKNQEFQVFILVISQHFTFYMNSTV